MSFNNLNFNVAKSTPTTSTTTASPLPVSSSKKNPKDVSSPLMMLGKGSGPVTTANVSRATTSGTQASANSEEKKDLKGIFSKYDVEVEQEVDSLEEKFEQFKTEPESEKADETNDTKTHESQSEPQDTLQEPKPQEEVIQKGAEVQEAEPQRPEAQEQEPEAQKKEPEIQDSQLQEPEPKEPANEDPKPQTNFQEPTTGPQDIQTQADLEPEKPESKHEETPDLMSMQPYDPEAESRATPETSNDLLTCEAGPQEVVLPEQPPQHPAPPQLKRNNSIAKASGVRVDDSEQHQQSHKPFDFQTFLGHLRKKSADPIVRYIRSFLLSFSRQASTMSAAQMIKATRHFRTFIESKFHEYEPFASMDAIDLENSIEGVEKLIMNRLYDFCFSPVAVRNAHGKVSRSLVQDVEEDAAFALQIEKYSWVSGVHLDVDLDELSRRKKDNSRDDIDYIAYAIKEFNKINSYRAPRDKIICILNACKIIFSLLRVTNNETNADAFIPLLILIILKSKTENIISNLRYIERFRGEDWLYHGETSYYLSTMQGAVTFIQNIKKEDLTIDQEHYDAHMEAWEAEMRQRPVSQPQPEHSQPQPPNRVLSPSDVLAASAEMFTKSLSNFMSPAETPEAETRERPQEEFTDEQVNEVLGQLSEMFPNLDKAVMRDVIIMNKAQLEQSLDGCLQLVNET